MSRATKYFWDNGVLHTDYNHFAFSYSFCPWIFNKSVVYGFYYSVFELGFANVTIETVFAAVQPVNVSLFIAKENSRIPEICCMYDCRLFG
jgi:hypothetical protein